MKILVIQTAFLGDVLLSIPTLLRLKTLYPDSHLTLLCRKGLGQIFRELKLATDVIEINKKNKNEFSKTFSELKKNQYDLLFCPHESPRSAFISLRIKAKQKIGFKNWWNGFIFSKSIERNLKLPDALRQLSLVGVIDPATKKEIELYFGNVPEWAEMGLRNKIIAHLSYQEVMNKFNIPRNAIFISPGSVWNTKRWTPDGFRKVAMELLKKHPVVFIGAPDERTLCEEIIKDIPKDSNLKNIAGETSLFELLVLMTTGKVLISNDSGAMHMGSVAELPTVAIFGPTVLEFGYQPWQKRAVVVENKELKCRPCGKHGHDKCPLGTHECMKSISSQKVLDAVKSLVHLTL